MKRILKRMISIAFTVLLCCTALQLNTFITATAVENGSIGEGEYEIIYNNDRIIVSLGDSFSSGEGIEPFYDDDIDIPGGLKNELGLTGEDEVINFSYTYINGKKVADLLYSKDWLCHRSENAWSGMLKLKDPATGNTITMKKHRGTKNTAGNWYFAAMSGAVTGNILDTDSIPDSVKSDAKKGANIPEKYKHRFKFFCKTVALKYMYDRIIPEIHKEYVEIEPQLNVFKQLKNKKAEYVTMTMGGNDVKFSEVIKDAVIDFDFLEFTGYNSRLEKKLTKVTNEYLEPMLNRVKECYKKISEKAGPQAHIIIVGYPRLIAAYTSNKSILFSKNDAKALDDAVKTCNSRLNKIVEKCQEEGMNISFVPVYDTFKNNVAYSSKNTDDELINRLQEPHTDDIDQTEPVSSYSIHPNIKGAKVYADCVQKEIDENEKKLKISGKVTDMEGNGLEGFKITLEEVGQNQTQKVTSNKDGEFFTRSSWNSAYGALYSITFEKKGYEPFIITERTDKTKGNNITVNVRLVPKCFDVNISGTVTDENGNPIDGAQVTISGGFKRIKEIRTIVSEGKEKQIEYMKTDRTQKNEQTVYTENGQYTVNLVNCEANNYEITVQKEPYETYENKNIYAERPDPPDEECNVAHDVVLKLHHYQLFSDMSYTWTQAKSYCESLGGHLVTITSEEETRDIIDMIRRAEDISNCYWIGLYLDGNNWTWVSGEPMEYCNWAQGEPNNFFGYEEKYVQLFGRDNSGFFQNKPIGSWNDAMNKGAYYAGDFYKLKNIGFICEWGE